MPAFAFRFAVCGAFACSLLVGCQQDDEASSASAPKRKPATSHAPPSATDDAITSSDKDWAPEVESEADVAAADSSLPWLTADPAPPPVTLQPLEMEARPAGTLTLETSPSLTKPAAPSDEPLTFPDPGETPPTPVKLVRAVEKEASAPAMLPSLLPAHPAATDLKPINTVSLFNGIDLTGWEVHEGLPDSWTVAEGVITCARQGGGWLRSQLQYSDFELRFEYRLSPGANTGVGLRFTPAGSPTLTGIEVQLIDDDAQKYADLRPDQHSGSLYYQFAPKQHSTRPVGDWNECAIIARGAHIQVTINGALVNDVQLDAHEDDGRPHPLASRPPIGHVGFQSSSQPIAFRNVTLTDLTTELPSGVRFVDVVEGDGEAATRDAKLTLHYTGRFVDGTKFDSSHDRGDAVTITLDQVIDGWKEGVPGMKVGGIRKLIVPPALAYGSQGVPGLVPPDATLVFEVELRGVAH